MITLSNIRNIRKQNYFMSCTVPNEMNFVEVDDWVVDVIPEKEIL